MTGLFWADLERDLADHKFRREFLRQSRLIARIDRAANAATEVPADRQRAVPQARLSSEG